MSELLTLFPLLFLVYLMQCIGSAPPASEVFLLGPRLRGRRLRHAFILGASGKRFFLLNPFLPPVGAALLQGPPFSFRTESNKGSMVLVSHQSPDAHVQEQFCPLDSAHEFTSKDTDVLVDDVDFLRVQTEEMAKELADLFAKIQKASTKRRTELVEGYFRKLFSLEELDQRLQVYSRAAEMLQVACSYLFVFIFVFVPPLIYWRGLEAIWILLLVDLVIAAFLIVWLYRRAFRLLYPCRRGKDLSQLVGIALSPFAAIRANDSVIVDLFSGFHPVAVASRIFSDKEFREFAGEALRKVKHLSSDPILLGFLERFLAKQDVDVESLLVPPEPESQLVHTFCPVCLTQYVIETGVCHDCGRIALKPFSALNAKKKEQESQT